jgi:hypothetical protein
MGMISRPLKETIQDMLQVSEFDIEEIREGFSKQVYRIKTKKDRYILYIWRRPLENKLTENQTKGAKYLFPDGFKYFIHNTKLLTDMGIRVPAIIFSGHRDEEDFDYALVECFEGQSYMEYMNKGGDIRTVADKVEVVMEKMASFKRSFYGPPMVNIPFPVPPVQLVFDFYAEELSIAAAIDSEISFLKSDLMYLMERKKNEVTDMDKEEYPLIHGELTPPHVYILENGEIGLIDIEGIKYFDIEYDRAVIHLAYGDAIPVPKYICKEKLEFYTLCLKIGHLSVAADYLAHVDKNHPWFQNVRESCLNELALKVR